MMRSRISKTIRFESAHFVPTFPDGHQCRRVHGHSFSAELIIEGEVDPAVGYLVEFGEIKRIAAPIVDQLDHRLLNEIEGLENPTMEVLAKWIYDRLKPNLPQLAIVRVQETQNNVAEYVGD